MRKLLCLIACLFASSIILRAQTNQPVTASLSMVETERAFARMSEEKGTRPSFMAFVADDGILFRPKAVKAKRWMIDHPLPPSDKRDLLSWGPSFADMAAAGDMGYTFGHGNSRAIFGMLGRLRGDTSSPSGGSRRTARGNLRLI